jgi:ABC-type transport system substrate-binding protein
MRADRTATPAVRLQDPRPRFAENLAISATFGAVAREVVEFYGDKIVEHPVGTGPFRLAQWRRSSQIVLERNPTYRERLWSAEPAPTTPKARPSCSACRAGGCRWWTAWKCRSSKKRSHAG